MTKPLSSNCCATLAIASLIAIGCESGTEPPESSEPPLRSVRIDVQPGFFATAEDAGPQDGEFDVYWDAPNLGMVNNNGFGNYRTTVEYELPVLPSDAVIVQVTLRLPLLIWDGTRSVQIHSYPGNGIKELTDFAANQLLETHVVSGHQNFVIDVKALVEARRATGGGFVGFNFREDPPNTENFTIMRVRDAPPPLLRIDYTTREAP